MLQDPILNWQWRLAFTNLAKMVNHYTQHVWNVLGLEKSPKHLGASKWVNQVLVIKDTSDEKV